MADLKWSLNKSEAGPQSPGRLIAAALRRAWDQSPPDLDLTTAQLDQIAPLLLRTGAGALAWLRIRDTKLEQAYSSLELQQSYRLHTIEAAVRELRIGQLLTGLREAGIEAVLVKGWAIARRYPEPGLRPYSDVDLIVRDDHYLPALDTVKRLKIPDLSVDLHQGVSNMGRMAINELYDRSQLITLGQIEARIPGEEDHLRMLCFHMLRHGVWRPLWLVDIAVAVETRSDNFDWDACLGDSRREREWITCSLGLASRLLGARIEETPVLDRANWLPGWLVSAVLRNWDRCSGTSQREPLMTALLSRVHNPRILIEEVRFRWDRPIEASLEVRAPFNRLPRLPFQLAALALRIPQLSRHLAHASGDREERV